MQKLFGLILFAAALSACAAEKKFDFGTAKEGQLPEGFRSTVSGKGKPGEWKILLDEEQPALPPLTPQARVVTKKAVLAQLAKDSTDDHYPLIVYDAESFGDFTLNARVKIVAGSTEQMAGIAFRIQDEKNYYYVRASALGNTFYFFKFVKGELIGPVGSKIEISTNAWHDIKVECQGSQITCSLDGKPIISQMQQTTFSRGKIGFWTKSDSVSYFSDAKITYTPLEAPAQGIVRDLLKKYPRLEALKIYVPEGTNGATRIVASNETGSSPFAGGKSETEVIKTGQTWYGKEDQTVSVIMPLKDRNGEPIAAVRVVMKSFKGQTEENAIVRAAPIVREIQERVSSMDDLTL